MPRFRIDRTCRTVVSVTVGDDVVIPRCHVADSWTARLVGLLGTSDLGPDEGVWIAPCRSVHTWGMRIAIACAFLDRAGRVVRVVDPLTPWRTASMRGAHAVIETRAGGLAGLSVGDVVRQMPPEIARPGSS